MTFSFLHWECSRTAGTGGLFTGILMIGLGILLVVLAFLRGTRVRGAFNMLEGTTATATHRAIFFLVGVNCHL